MAVQDEFLRQVKDALAHLYDYSYLDDHPLALRYWPDAGQAAPNRAQRLHRFLLESIEGLNPPTATLKDSSRARGYLLLAYRYVEERPLSDILRELGYSRRQYFREQRKAIAMLAASLQEALPPTAGQPAEPGDLLASEAGLVLAETAVTPPSAAVDPAEIVQGVLKVIGSLAEEHKVTLECTLDQPLPSIHGNRTLLRQVFLNALSNLITQPGTHSVRLRMHSEQRSVRVELNAECGMRNAEWGMGRAECGVRKAEGGRRNVECGTDAQPLELEPLRRLVEIVGGQWHGFEVSPTGCTCRFDLPADLEQVVLVIEDNEAVIRAFQRYLAGTHYQVVGATTGAEALRKAREVQPTAITLDIMMPTQDGWEILQALKDEPATRHIPVVICSVLEDPELTRSLGAAAYLRKPVTQADLLAVLGRLASRLQGHG
jgi:CheY-like chemotaxis protein